MPVLDTPAPEATDSPLGSFPKLAQQSDSPSPSFLDVAASAERTGNVVSQLFQRVQDDTLVPAGADDPNFNPIDHIPQGYLHDYGSRFLSSSNPAQIAQVKRQIDSERSDQGVIARAGGWGTAASIAAGATDPLTLASMALVPEAAPTRLGNMLRWGLTNAATTAGQELVSQALSDTKTPGESLLNIGAGAVLGGLLGGIARTVPKGELDRVGAALSEELKPGGGESVLGPDSRNILDGTLPSDHPEVSAHLEANAEAARPEEIKGEEPEVPKPEETTPPEITQPPSVLPDVEAAHVNPEDESTMGAAAVSQPTREGLSPSTGGGFISQTIGKVAPAARIMDQASIKARELVTQLANIPGTLTQNFRGVANANPIERILWGYDGVNVQTMQARRALFKEYLQRIQKEGGTPLGRRDFMEGVSSAMRRGDKSEVPEIAKAAKVTREKVFNPLYERAQKLGMLPEEAKIHADSYLTRQYDATKINGRYGEWIDTLRTGFIHQGVDPSEATDIAHSVSRNVLGSERGTMDWNAMDGIVSKSGATKERTLALPDTLLEPFLNNDIDHLSHSYLRSMAPEVELTDRFGSRDLKDQFADITDEYANLIERARAKGDVAGMTKLDAQRDSTIRDLSAIRDRLYGTYGAPKDPSSFAVRSARVLRSVNALRLLGAATLAHFPDVANVISRYGFGNTFAAMGKLATSMQAMKLTFTEAQRMGAALDMVMNVSASLLGDYGSHSRFLEQRIASGAARAFTIGTGETPLITLVQAMTSTLAQDEILRQAGKVAAGKNVSKNLMAKLAAAGLDSGMLGRIAKEGATNARKVNGLTFGMSDKWADQKAAQAFESAILREAHGVTLRPGVGDTPLMMSTEWGKTLLQFKSFAFAASRSVGMPLAQGLAHGDLRTIEALTALTAMGTLSYIAKQKASGQPLESNPGRLAGEVLDKSNLLGWTGEMIFPALWQAGFKDLSRFSDRDPVETIGGPTAGMLASAFERQYPARIANLATGGAVAPNQQNLPFRRSDLHFLRRMAPGQNTWYFRRGVNYLEDRMGDLFGLPGESNEDRDMKNEETVSVQ